jgi:hypothetical protein
VISDTVFTPSNPFKVAVSPADRLVYAEQDNVSDLYLYDSETYELLDVHQQQITQPDILFDQTGDYLFAGEGATEGARLHRWDVGGDALEAHEVSGGEGYYNPNRKILIAQNHVYYAGCQYDQDNLLAPIGCFGEDIWMVTPDDTLAFSASRIYSTATFAVKGSLSGNDGVMAVTPDSETLYQFDNATGELYPHGNLSQYK